MTELKPGLRAKVETVVTETDLAIALGSGDVRVLGTPRMVALAEAATVAAVAGSLEEGRTTVGTHVDVRHLAPSQKGSSITAAAELTAIEGKLLTFRIEVHDGDRLVGDGVVERAIVSRERFGG